MAHVAFALGDQPRLSQEEALELAELLRHGSSFAAQSASRKIRSQASRDPDRGEVSGSIELDRDELEELEAVLAQEQHPEFPGFERLQNEIRQTLREGPPPSGGQRI